MKVIVDYDLCEANAYCQRSCSEVFRVEEDDTLTLLVADIPDRLREQVEEAARLCPRQALRIEG
ncbi:MAG: ferredoxin [Deltaproteobacteria bacterium]|jgi:ferredoxin|nr:ferredoxin [Deltaproteobacteria bacterium]